MKDREYKKSLGSLAGKYFHSVNKVDHTTIEWQGRFVSLASPGIYLVQLYDWITGYDSEQLLVPAVDMRYWKIYDDPFTWHRAYEDYTKRREGVPPAPRPFEEGWTPGNGGK